MEHSRAILLGGSAVVIGVILYLTYEKYEGNSAASAANSQANSEGSAAAEAILGEGVEATNVPAGGSLPSVPVTEAPEGTLTPPAPGMDNIAFSVNTQTGQAYNAAGEIINPANIITGFSAAAATGGGTQATKASQ
jgi:hypothetical protein